MGEFRWPFICSESKSGLTERSPKTWQEDLTRVEYKPLGWPHRVEALRKPATANRGQQHTLPCCLNSLHKNRQQLQGWTICAQDSEILSSAAAAQQSSVRSLPAKVQVNWMWPWPRGVCDTLRPLMVRELYFFPSPPTKHGLLYLQLPLNLLCHQGWLYDPELLILLPPPCEFWASITRPGSCSARYRAQGFLHVRQALDQLCCISSQHFDFLN